MSALIAMAALAVATAANPVNATFASNEHHEFSSAEMELIQTRMVAVHARVEADFPHLSDQINVTIDPVHRPILDEWGGVSGRADQADAVLVEFTTNYLDGIAEGHPVDLDKTLAHEFHHTARGWLMNGNHYGHGIQIAVINEGLAMVYAEHVTGDVADYDLPPENVEEWALEVLASPRAASYAEWMFTHPDGREAIGYRTGRWVVLRAMERSGLSIIELSDMTPEAIWRLAGFNWDRALR
ncbi:MAG: DUF2268 domain-containing protein [Alphaproteobacteria bacterium]|nr:DUF2268 domain-containing protein [Alphaproteobacteria bacterium]